MSDAHPVLLCQCTCSWSSRNQLCLRSRTRCCESWARTRSHLSLTHIDDTPQYHETKSQHRGPMFRRLFHRRGCQCKAVPTPALLTRTAVLCNNNTPYWQAWRHIRYPCVRTLPSQVLFSTARLRPSSCPSKIHWMPSSILPSTTLHMEMPHLQHATNASALQILAPQNIAVCNSRRAKETTRN